MTGHLHTRNQSKNKKEGATTRTISKTPAQGPLHLLSLPLGISIPTVCAEVEDATMAEASMAERAQVGPFAPINGPALEEVMLSLKL